MIDANSDYAIWRDYSGEVVLLTFLVRVTSSKLEGLAMTHSARFANAALGFFALHSLASIPLPTRDSGGKCLAR